MSEANPRLLQPWGILVLVAVAAIAFFATYRWSTRREGRPPLHLDVAAIVLLGLLTGGFFWRPLTEQNIWMPAGGGDFASFYFPTFSYVAGQIQSGTLPLWNPHLFAGMPLAADVQSAMFYPLNWLLFLFVRVDYGSLEWLLIAHYWLASVFFYLFLRDCGLRRLGALAGGIAFAFCGFMVAHFGHLPMVPVATWIPLQLLALRRAYLHAGLAGWAWAIGAGFFMALSLLAGHVQIFAYGLMACGLLWLLLLLERREITLRYAGEWVARGALALLIALGIGALQLLPSLELSTQSVRSAVSYEQAMEFPAQPVTLLNLLLPRVYGANPVTYNFNQWQTTENWGYCGVVTIVLAIAGLVFRRGRMVTFFALLAALALIIMAGDLTVVGGWIYRFVPGFSKLRDTGRALALLGMGLAGLAGFGLDALMASLEGRWGVRRNVFWWLVGLTAAIAVTAFGVMPAFYEQILLNQGAEYGRLPGAINDLGMLLLWLGLLAGVGWAAYRRRLGAITAGALMFALLVLDLFSPNSQFNPTTQDVTAGFEHYDAISFLQKNTPDNRSGIPLRVNSDTDVQDRWQPSTAVLYNLYDTGGAWNPLKLERYDYLWGVAKRYPDTPLYDLTGAAFEVISPTVQAHAGQPKWVLSYQDDALQIYRNNNALPRAFLVHESRVESKPESIVLAIRRFDVAPAHTVILESGKPTPSTELGSAETGASGESVRATRYAPNAVDITVDAKSPGWLVLTDAWYPGWVAEVDGRPATIEPADYAYRAVHVEAGRHQVSMQFRPSTWVWGRVASAVSAVAAVLGLALLFAWPRLRGRQRGDQQVVDKEE